MFRSWIAALVLLPLVPACNTGDKITVELLIHESVGSVQIGDSQIDPQSASAKYLGVQLPAGEHDVRWNTASERFTARIRVLSNSDNYLLLTDREPWLEVDGGLQVIKPAQSIE